MRCALTRLPLGDTHLTGKLHPHRDKYGWALSVKAPPTGFTKTRFSIGLRLLYLTEVGIASSNLHKKENWKYKQKHSHKTVQNYKDGMEYEKIFSTNYGNNSAAVLCV